MRGPSLLITLLCSITLSGCTPKEKFLSLARQLGAEGYFVSCLEFEQDGVVLTYKSGCLSQRPAGAETARLMHAMYSSKFGLQLLFTNKVQPPKTSAAPLTLFKVVDDQDTLRLASDFFEARTGKIEQVGTVVTVPVELKQGFENTRVRIVPNPLVLMSRRGCGATGSAAMVNLDP